MTAPSSARLAGLADGTAAPVVSVLVVAYNSAAIIADCLASIPEACTRYRYEVLLIDNGDGSTETLVAKEFPSVQIVPSQGNVGFAAANNILAAQAQGEHLLLLNPDVELKKDALDILLDAASTYPAAAAFGGVTLDRDGRPDLGNTVHVPSLREMASRVLGRSSARADPLVQLAGDAKVEALSGSLVMFRRTAWDEVGGLDARYFLYCEEIDLFYRLAKKGHSFWRVSAARGFHDIGHGEALSPTRMLYRAAGTMQFARLHWNGLRQALAFLFLWLGAWQRFVAGKLLGHWSKHLKNVGDCHRDIALRPKHWRFGYDERRGLLARMRRE